MMSDLIVSVLSDLDRCFMCGSRWQEAWSLYESTMSADSVAEVWEALRPPPTIVCEVCLRERLTERFPGSVVASVIHHLALPGRDPRRTVWSCKECRAQQVAERERIEAFLNFRLPDA